jgi:hypothetical protein
MHDARCLPQRSHQRRMINVVDTPTIQSRRWRGEEAHEI